MEMQKKKRNADVLDFPIFTLHFYLKKKKKKENQGKVWYVFASRDRPGNTSQAW